MKGSGRFLVAQLPQVANPAKFGSQAVDLARLAAAGFSVPRGFAISVDGYHAQVWVCGAKTLAEGSEVDQARGAELIGTTDIPQDVQSEILSAYHHLSLQTGVPEPAVVLRASRVDEAAGDDHAPITASGEDDLLRGVREIWSRAWLSRAETASGGKDPGAGVVVCRSLDADLTGTAATIDPYSGNPNLVKLRWQAKAGPAAACSVDLQQMQVITESGEMQREITEPGGLDSLAQSNTASDQETSQCDTTLAFKLAEMAILAEETLGRPSRLEWARERDTIWLVDAEEIGGVSGFFPSSDVNDSLVTAWKRIASKPVCETCAGIISGPPDQSGLPAPDSETHLQMVNGYVYFPLYKVPDSPAALWKVSQEESGRYAKLVQVWGSEVEPGLDRIRKRIPEYLSTSDTAVKLEGLSKLAEGYRSALAWLCASVRPGIIYPAAAAGKLSEKGILPLLRAVLTGLPDPVILRDAKLQELADRLKAAGKANKLKDEQWWKEFRAEAAGFAEQWGYGFTRLGEMFDFSTWKSWPEDLNPVYHAIRALSQRDDRPTIITLHTHATEQAAAAQADAEAPFSGLERTRLRKTLNLSREWLVIAGKCGLNCAIYGSALRRLCLAIGAKLAAEGTVPSAEDVFHLTVSEIICCIGTPLSRYQCQTSGLSGQGCPERTKDAVGRLIAHRKHVLWARSRLDAPECLPPSGDVAEYLSAITSVVRTVFAASPVVSGKVVFADSYAKAGETEPDAILTVTEPMAGWSPFFGAVGGFVSQEPPLLPNVPILAAQYELPAVFGCPHVGLASHGGNRISVDAAQGKAKYHW